MKVAIDKRVVDNTAKKTMELVEMLIEGAESDSLVLRHCEMALHKIAGRIEKHWEEDFVEFY